MINPEGYLAATGGLLQFMTCLPETTPPESRLLCQPEIFQAGGSDAKSIATVNCLDILLENCQTLQPSCFSPLLTVDSL